MRASLGSRSAPELLVSGAGGLGSCSGRVPDCVPPGLPKPVRLLWLSSSFPFLSCARAVPAHTAPRRAPQARGEPGEVVGETHFEAGRTEHNP